MRLNMLTVVSYWKAIDRTIADYTAFYDKINKTYPWKKTLDENPSV